MEDFKERIRQQKKTDRQVYRDAVTKMETIVDKNVEKGHKRDGKHLECEQIGWTILDYFKIPHIEIPEEISNVEGLEYILDSAHIMKRIVLLEKDWWKWDSFPLLVKVKETGEYQVLFPGKRNGYYKVEADTGQEKRITRKDAEEYETEAFCLYPPFEKQHLGIKAFLCSLWRPFGIWDWGILIALTFLVIIMGIVLPFVNEFIFDTIIPSGTKDDIFPIAALLFGVVFTTGIFRLMKSIWVIRMGDKGKLWMEAGLWNRIFRLPVRFFKDYEAGDLTNRIFMISDICETVQKGLLPVLLTMAFSVVYLFQIQSLSQALIGPSCLILVLVLVLTLANALLKMKINRELNQTDAKISGFLYQIYSGIRKIKLCGAEVRVFAKWANMYEKKGKSQFRQPFFVKYSGTLQNIVIVGGSLLIYHVVFREKLSASVYISYQIAFGNLLAVVFQLGVLADAFAFLVPALKMAEPLLIEEEESGIGRNKVSSLQGEIELSNVSFRYQPDMDYILRDFHLTIHPGEYVAVVGPSGCGKSTLFRLLLGFEQAEKGAIYYDGRDLSMLEPRSVRKRIGTVLQDGKLFEGDIFANISLCAPELTMEEAWEAAEAAGLAEDIEAMPMGMFTMVSENDGGISGGQKQRILIARVLAMKPDVLLFDEATSALDNITQEIVVRSIEEMKGTRIVIAHRLSTIKKCDRILYLKDGKVAEDGTYEELMALDGGFATLAKRQLA